MKNIIFIVFSCLIYSCHSTTLVDKTDDSCIDYYAFLHENIIKTSGGWYEFVSLENLYLKYDKGELAYPFLHECLKGKDKSFFIKNFGVPNREINVPNDDYNVFIYCFDEICINEKKCYSGLSSMGFITYFDQENKYIDITSFIDYKTHYKSLDRE